MNCNLYEIIINSLSAHVAVLDEEGIIVQTNRAWQEYALQNGLGKQADSVGVNYLGICKMAAADGEREGELVASGIEKILSGELLEYVLQYPCHSSTRRQWFTLRLLPYLSEAEHWVLVVHEDVTPLFLAQEELEKKEKELLEKSEKLQEMNVALNVLLEHRERELAELEQRLTANIRELVLPYVEKLQDSLQGRSRVLADIVQTNLNNIISPFLKRLSSLNLLLTPQEVEVATLVRSGKSSQEIADVLGVSISTISFHRKNLRRKLDLKDRGVNLRTYLLSLK